MMLLAITFPNLLKVWRLEYGDATPFSGQLPELPTSVTRIISTVEIASAVLDSASLALRTSLVPRLDSAAVAQVLR